MDANTTSFPEAVDYDWNHWDDWSWTVDHQKLSTYEKVSKLVSDCVVYAFAFLLGAQNDAALKSRIKLNVDGYDKFVSNNEYWGQRDLENKNIILVILGDNGIAADPEFYRQLEEESESKVMFIQYNSNEELFSYYKTLQNNAYKIKALWIRTHGFPKLMQFTDNKRLNISPLSKEETTYISHGFKNRLAEAEDFVQKSAEILEENAPFILESCSTAKQLPEGEENIAQFFARHAKGHAVYAPHQEVIGIDKQVSYSKDNGFKVTFAGFKNSRKFAKGSLMARLCAVWHASRKAREDITVKNYQPASSS